MYCIGDMLLILIQWNLDITKGQSTSKICLLLTRFRCIEVLFHTIYYCWDNKLIVCSIPRCSLSQRLGDNHNFSLVSICAQRKTAIVSVSLLNDTSLRFVIVIIIANLCLRYNYIIIIIVVIIITWLPLRAIIIMYVLAINIVITANDHYHHYYHIHQQQQLQQHQHHKLCHQ